MLDWLPEDCLVASVARNRHAIDGRYLFDRFGLSAVLLLNGLVYAPLLLLQPAQHFFGSGCELGLALVRCVELIFVGRPILLLLYKRGVTLEWSMPVECLEFRHYAVTLAKLRP